MTSAAATPIVHQHFTASIAAADRFFAAATPAIADCCRRLAERFAAGGTLVAIGEGAQASDAHHVAVEFVHPVIVGKRALPAVALTGDFAMMAGAPSGAARSGTTGVPVTLLSAADIVLGLTDRAAPPRLGAALASARERGALTVLVSGVSSAAPSADVEFAIGEDNPLVVQEVSETLYHVLWELVHVFLEAADAAVTSFLPARANPSPQVLLQEVAASAREKARDVNALRLALLGRDAVTLGEAARALAGRVRQGGRIFPFGNGGSATDAHDAAADCLVPPVPGWRPIPAVALTATSAILTAIANDVGFERVFERQLAAYGRPADVALAFSTSGASRNLLAAMAEAKARGLLTIALSGGDGGELARSGSVDCCFTVPSEYVPRIQEAQATAWHALLAATQEALAS